MTEHVPVDLIHLSYEVGGTSVVVQVTDVDSMTHDGLPILGGEIRIAGGMVSGIAPTFVFPEDLDSWEEALDALAAGQDIAWREDQRATELHIFLNAEPHYTVVSVRDRMGALATVELSMELPEDWIADHHTRLEQVRKTWSC